MSALLAFLKGLPLGSRIGMESTGIYHELFANLTHKYGFIVFVFSRLYSAALAVRTLQL